MSELPLAVPSTTLGEVMRLPPHPLDGEWFSHSAGETFGPYTGHQVAGFIKEGRIQSDTQVMRVDGSEWRLAKDDAVLAGLFKAQAPIPPPHASHVSAAPGATVVQVTNTVAPASRPVIFEDGPAKAKSAGVALLLSILCVGLGQIYNGQVGKGLLMFILCVGMWFVLLGWIIMIWSWLDAYKQASRMNDRYLRRLAAGYSL